jgi:hypothetical protein
MEGSAPWRERPATGLMIYDGPGRLPDGLPTPRAADTSIVGRLTVKFP